MAGESFRRIGRDARLNDRPVVRTCPDLKPHDGPDVGRFVDRVGPIFCRVAKQQRLAVRVIFVQIQAPFCRGGLTQGVGESGQELGQQPLPYGTLARFGQCFEAMLSLLAGGRVERIAFTAEPQSRTVKGQVHVFRKSLDDPEHLGERRATFE